jgi:hypothetical protein
MTTVPKCFFITRVIIVLAAHVKMYFTPLSHNVVVPMHLNISHRKNTINYKIQ